MGAFSVSNRSVTAIVALEATPGRGMAYDRDDIEKIRQSTSIVDLVSAVTTVKKTGRSHKAICPFHQEKTPSMSLDPARGFYHCFGCGAGGDIFKFVQETQGLDFSDSVELLARQAGVTLRVDPQAARRRGERQGLIDAVEAAVVFYNTRLKTGPDAGGARSYLRGRGYDGEVVDEFELGFSPADSRTDLVRHLKQTGVSEKAMLDAGLARRSQRGSVIDWFHGRVMFPIRDVKGDAVGFGARLLEGDGPKYLNTPETKLYSKAKLLYGLDRARKDITRKRLAIVVEGYTDVIALHRAGMPLAVASCGTALGEDHFDLLRRFTDHIVLAFDADQAGAGAAIRGDELHLPAELGLDLRVARMPEGRDPADLVQDGDAAALMAAIEDSVPLLMFRLEREVGSHRLNEPEGRARAVQACATIVGRLSDKVARAEYARYIVRLTGADAAAVTDAVEQAARTKKTSKPGTRRAGPSDATSSAETPSAPKRKFPPARNGVERLELEVLRLMVSGHLGVIVVEPEWLSRDDYREVFMILLAQLSETDRVDINAIADEGVRDFLRSVMLDDSPEAKPREIADALHRQAIDRKMADLRARLENASEQEYSQMQYELIALEKRKREIGFDGD